MLYGNYEKTRTITEIAKEKHSLIMKSKYGMQRITIITPDIIRITYTTKKQFQADQKPGVIYTQRENNWSFQETASQIIITTTRMKVTVEKETGSIQYDTLDGQLIFKERGAAAKCFESYETYTLSDADSKTEIIHTADGDKSVIREAGKIYTGDSFHITWYPEWGEEALYGLGQHEEGYSSLRGKTLYLHQANRAITIPMLVSTKGYGILIDTYSPLIFNDTSKTPYIYNESAQELDYYFIYGGTCENVIKGYRLLTGKASMLPKWAYGFIQSQERYETAEEILDTVSEYRKRKIGLDCIVLDWISWEDGMWGQKTFDRSRFKDPSKMMEDLHEKNCHFMISIWPSIDPKCENHKEFAEKNLFLKGCNVYNALSKEARDIYWKQLMEDLVPAGVDSWWCDSSEPITPEWNVKTRPEPSRLYQMYVNDLGLRIHPDYSNSYCYYHALGIYEGQRNYMKEQKGKNPTFKEKRVCNLTRSAYTGQQRLGTIMWSGDIEAKWATLQNQLGAGLNFSASGIPYWTFDVGAFFVRKADDWYWDGDYPEGNQDLGYQELYTRWYQIAGFMPVFRCHGTDFRRELWHYGKEGEPFYDALVKANELRYRLLPYIYSEAGKVWLWDKSLINHLAMIFSDDSEVYEITNQYMFGESIMVCPVTTPMYYEKNSTPLKDIPKTREVYLPKECDWYDFYTGKKYTGGQKITVDAPIDRIPLFVKNGTIIPMQNPVQSSLEQAGPLIKKVFSDHPCTYEFYTDEGDGYDYENGAYTITKLLQ